MQMHQAPRPECITSAKCMTSAMRIARVLPSVLGEGADRAVERPSSQLTQVGDPRRTGTASPINKAYFEDWISFACSGEPETSVADMFAGWAAWERGWCWPGRWPAATLRRGP